jgi:anaerobic carbon-monoxide dehydrogenase iron sulfur subunit
VSGYNEVRAVEKASRVRVNGDDRKKHLVLVFDVPAPYGVSGMTKSLITIVQRCLGCKSCEIECALAHSVAGGLVEALSAGRPLQPRIHVEASGRFGVPMQCRHCDDAPCVAVCPTEALHRAVDSGVVLLDKGRCIGCGLCVLACPFGSIERARGGTGVVKCDQCVQRADAGEDPACVAGCPTGALRFAEIAGQVRDRRRQAAMRVAGAEQYSEALAES